MVGKLKGKVTAIVCIDVYTETLALMLLKDCSNYTRVCSWWVEDVLTCKVPYILINQ